MNGMMMPMSTPNNTMPDMDGCSMAGMMMYFHTGNCEYILFESLKTTKAAEMGGACVVIFFLGVLYEGLKVFREYLLRRALTKNLSSSSKNGSYATGVAVIDGSSKNGSAPRAEFDIDGSKKSVGQSEHLVGTVRRRASMLSCSHFIQTLLHMLQVFISYCLMLVFMTYNAWLCIAIILGAGSGYFLFGWKRAVVVDVNEHCH